MLKKKKKKIVLKRRVAFSRVSFGFFCITKNPHQCSAGLGNKNAPNPHSPRAVCTLSSYGLTPQLPIPAFDHGTVDNNGKIVKDFARNPIWNDVFSQKKINFVFKQINLRLDSSLLQTLVLSIQFLDYLLRRVILLIYKRCKLCCGAQSCSVSARQVTRNYKTSASSSSYKLSEFCS